MQAGQCTNSVWFQRPGAQYAGPRARVQQGRVVPIVGEDQNPVFIPSAHALQVAALRAQLAEKEAELEGLGEGLGGLERENSNLEAQVWAPGMFSELPAVLIARAVGHGRGATSVSGCARRGAVGGCGSVHIIEPHQPKNGTPLRPCRWTR